MKRTHASFRGRFSKERKLESPEGSDLVDLLAKGLKASGYQIECDETDYSHELIIHVGKLRFHGMVGLVDDGDREWLFFAESTIGWIGRLLGKKDDIQHDQLLEHVHKLFSEDEKVSDLRWYTLHEWNENPEMGHAKPTM